MEPLIKKRCVPCEGGLKPLSDDQSAQLLKQLKEGWSLIHHRLEKVFAFKNFKEALAFTNEVGRIAEEEQHHPVITLTWGEVKLSLWTHKIDGLTESDFILAAKCDVLLPS